MRNRRAAVSLTRAGHTFRIEARRALDALDHAERIGRAAARLEAGALTIGYVFTAGINGVLAEALRALRERRPLIEVTPVPMETPEQIAAIAEGRIDLGLIRPRDTYPANVRVRPVHEETLLLLHGSPHRLSGLADLRRADLRDERFIIPQFGERNGLTKAVGDLLVEEHGQLAPLATGDFISAINMAAAGLGVVLAPRSLGGLKIADVRARPIVDFTGTIEMALAWRDGDVSRIADILFEGVPTG